MVYYYAILLFFCLFKATRGFHIAFDNTNNEDVYTCAIQGFVGVLVQTLNGTFENCQNPPMNCTMPTNEYLDKRRTNIFCRVPSDDWFFYDDKACSYRSFVRHRYCRNRKDQCFNVIFACKTLTTPTPLFIALLLLATITIVTSIIAIIAYCIYDRCWRTTVFSIPKQEKHLEEVRRKSEKLRKQYQKIETSL